MFPLQTQADDDAYGILKPSPEGCQIHNRIFEQRIYSYMMTKRAISEPQRIFAVWV